jgi:hypothetical protein
MKAFAAHLKEIQVVYDTKATRKLGRPKAKWVKVVFQVPSGNHRTVMSIASRLSKHFDETWANRYLTVIHPFGAEMSVIRAARHLLETHNALVADKNVFTTEAGLHALGVLLDTVRALPEKELGLV